MFSIANFSGNRNEGPRRDSNTPCTVHEPCGRPSPYPFQGCHRQKSFESSSSCWNETFGERLAQSSFQATRYSKCLFRPTRGQVFVSKEKFLGNEGRPSGLPDNPQHPHPGGALRLHSPRGAMTRAGVHRP